MNIWNNTIRAGLVLGLYGLASPASADVFNPNFSVIEVHGAGAGNTSGSFAASAMMGAKGHSNQPLFASWEPSITSTCATQTGSSPWPGGCNPAGMASTLASLTGRIWVEALWSETDQASALNEIVASLQLHGSPGIVPIYGQADHWVAIIQVTATANGSGWTVGNVKFYDGGPVGAADGSTNSYEGGVLSYSGNVFKNVYYRVIENINPSCDPCVSDPWYGKYVLMWEPPPGQTHTNIVTEFPRAPGVFPGTLTEPLARALVWRSLTAAGINRDLDVWSAISGGVAGTAFEVNGVSPTGERWDYFLVPILSATNRVLAFVQLAADGGAFESVHVQPSPMQYAPVSRHDAELIARGELGKDESLSSGILTWDPRASTPFAKAPTFPYYEFGVMNGAKEIGLVRVSLHKGSVIRTSTL